MDNSIFPFESGRHQPTSAVKVSNWDAYLEHRLDRFVERLMFPEIAPLPDPSVPEMIAVEPSVAHLMQRVATLHECAFYNRCQGGPINKWVDSTAGLSAVNPLLRSLAAGLTLEAAVWTAMRPGLCTSCECEIEENLDTEMCQHLHDREGGAW